MKELFTERARLFDSAAANKIEIEGKVQGMFFYKRWYRCNDVGGSTVLSWMNSEQRLHEDGLDLLQIDDMYQYIAVLLRSQTTGLRFEKAIGVLKQFRRATPSHYMVR